MRTAPNQEKKPIDPQVIKKLKSDVDLVKKQLSMLTTKINLITNKVKNAN